MRVGNATFEGETLVLPKGETHSIYDSVLRECVLTLDCAGRDLILGGSLLEDCKIVARRRFARKRWSSVRLTRCTFEGTYSENWFGCDPGPSAMNLPRGSIERCDFSKAILDYCIFLNTDISRHALPGWPVFTLLNSHYPALRTLPWPGGLELYVGDRERMPSEVANSFYVPTLLKHHTFDPDALRELLTGVEGVIL